MILLWSERKLLVRIVFYLNFLLSLQYSESCELSSLQWPLSIYYKIIADSAKQFKLRMRRRLFY